MRVSLLGGAYEAQSVIANAQSCINLYPEFNPKSSQSPTPVTHYPTPGLRIIINSPDTVASRGLYRASNGDLYQVIGGDVYYVTPAFTKQLVGSITRATTPISMTDNGLVIVIVDGSTTGWVIDLTTREFAIINDPAFYGSRTVGYLDTFLLFHKPDTNQWYISLSNVTFPMLAGTQGPIVTAQIFAGGAGYTDSTYPDVAFVGGHGDGAIGTIIISGGTVIKVTLSSPGTGYVVGDVITVDDTDVGGTGSGFKYKITQVTGSAFDALDIATKNGNPDPIEALTVIQGYVWLVGQVSSEVWFLSGGTDFAFSRLPGVNIIQHGTIAPYSLCAQDLFPYWISQDNQGQNIILKAENYQPRRISTHAIENELSTYSTVADCISSIYQQEGHTFVMFHFPTADKTWVYDQATELWHQEAWTDNNGVLHRRRFSFCANAYQNNVSADWENGNLYAIDSRTYTDNGQPISRIRSFPHLVKDGKREFYSQLLLDMAVGNDPNTVSAAPPVVSLRYSDDRGVTYGNKIEQSVGASGQYLTSVQYNRLGYARDRVFEVSWSAPIKTALQGAWITSQSSQT